MKAAVVEGPGRLVVRDVPEPEEGDYGAFCELLYGATCTGTDTHLIHRDEPFASWVDCPFILGHESIGRVLRVGSRVRNLQPGDLVTRVGTPAVGECDVAWGGFAEYGVALDWRAMQQDGLPPERWRGSRWNQVLPQDTDPKAATMIITWRETLSYLQRMGLGRGDTLAVVGSGGNGLSFVAQARNLGAHTIAMIGAPERRERAQRAGVKVFADYHASDAGDQILEVCPAGYDYVVDALGRTEQANLGLSLLKPGGTIGVYGMDEANGLRLDPACAQGTFTVNKNFYDEAETHRQVVALMQAGKLDAGIWLDLNNPFPLEDIGEAFEAVWNREMVKALVKLRKSPGK